MKVSVLLTVYGQAEVLPRALDSALAQEGVDLEVLVADDASPDAAAVQAAARRDDPRVHFHRNPENLGKTGNYREALHRATGDLATVLNADDYLLDPTYLARTADLFRGDSAVALVFGRVRSWIEAEQRFVDDRWALPETMDGTWLLLHHPTWIPQVTSVFRRQDALDLDFYSRATLSDDWEGFFRLIQGRRVGFLDQPAGVYVKHRANVTKTTDLDRVFQGCWFVESACRHARAEGTVPGDRLERWRRAMRIRYFLKWYVKLSYLAPLDLPAYRDRLHREAPDVAARVLGDPRLAALGALRGHPSLLRWLFRHLLRQESFIADLQAHA